MVTLIPWSSPKQRGLMVVEALKRNEALRLVDKIVEPTGPSKFYFMLDGVNLSGRTDKIVVERYADYSYHRNEIYIIVDLRQDKELRVLKPSHVISVGGSDHQIFRGNAVLLEQHLDYHLTRLFLRFKIIGEMERIYRDRI